MFNVRGKVLTQTKESGSPRAQVSRIGLASIWAKPKASAAEKSVQLPNSRAQACKQRVARGIEVNIYTGPTLGRFKPEGKGRNNAKT